MDDLLPIISAAGGVLCAGLPIIWRLASRLQKMESAQDSRAEEQKSKFGSLGDDIEALRDDLTKGAGVERGGRKELWVEVSALRERLVKIETKLNGAS